MKIKSIHVGAALGLAMLASPAMAGSLTGNVGAVSDYMFRGVDQSAKGAAVQGGVDYVTDLGIYVGAWFSNAAAANGNEADLYAGWAIGLGPFNLEAGLIHYLYTEDTEDTGGGGVRTNLDYTEVHVGAGVGPIALKVFFSPEFGGDVNDSNGDGTPDNISGDLDRNEMLYVSASSTLSLTDTLAFVPQLGFSAGDGVKDAFGDEYLDYSLSAVKRLKDDLSVTLSIVGTDRELPVNSGNNDNPTFVIGFKKNFAI